MARGGRGRTHDTTTAGLCLKWRGAIGAVPEQLHSGHRGCESGRGRRLLAAGNAVGAGVGVWESLWGRVSAVGRGEGGTPPAPSSDSLHQGHVPSSALPPPAGGMTFGAGGLRSPPSPGGGGGGRGGCATPAH